MADIFKFRQFEVLQRNCRMKVGTDAALLGALVDLDEVGSILDVGAGNGVIAMMLAQRCNAKITGIEIDMASFKECQFNFSKHPESNRLSALHANFTEVVLPSNSVDLIVSNPPFYDAPNSSVTGNLKSNAAKQQLSLRHDDLIKNCLEILRTSGKLAVVLPVKESHLFDKTCFDKGLYLNREVTIYGRLGKEAVRRVTEYSIKKAAMKRESLTIELHKRHEYSPEYLSLMRDFLFLE